MVSGSDHIDIQTVMKSKGKEMWETLFQYCESERGEEASMDPRVYDTSMPGEA